MKRFLEWVRKSWQQEKAGFIAFVAFIVLISLGAFYALGGIIMSIVGPTSTQDTVGGYTVYRTEAAQDYLEMLSSLDEKGYKIINISCGEDEGEAYYIITYSTKEP